MQKIYVMYDMGNTNPKHSNRVNLHIVCEMHLQSVDLYTKHFWVINLGREIPFRKNLIIDMHKIYVMYDMGNTNPKHSNRVNLHIVCQMHLQSVDLYTKPNQVIKLGREIPFSKNLNYRHT